jgi:fumarate hydratase subunit alpha
MRQVKTEKISEAVARLCKQSNYFLPEDVLRSLKSAYQKESSDNGKWVLGQIIENAALASQKEIPLCQDTGTAEVFIDIGQEVELTGQSLKEAVNKGVAKGYQEGYLRKSIVKDPLNRVNTRDNTPAKLYISTVPGKSVEITFLPKGGGSENASALKMLMPSQGWEGIKKFVIDAVKEKGMNACPPLIVGVGIGGSFSSVGLLAKRSLLRSLADDSGRAEYSKKEKELLQEINGLGIGPMGLGGKTTALAVHIEAEPCHIASLPVAVSIQCHCARRGREKI